MARRTAGSCGANTASAATGPPSQRMYCGLNVLLVIVAIAAAARISQPSVTSGTSPTARARNHSQASTSRPATVATVEISSMTWTPAPNISVALYLLVVIDQT